MSSLADQDRGLSGSPRRGSPVAFPLLCAAAAALLGGCGGDGERAAASPDAEAGTGAAATDTVEIAEFEYGPETAVVEAGDELSWRNRDRAPHTATADQGAFDTGTLERGDVGPVSFDQPGRYAYYCRFHPFMKGTVEVR